MCRFCALIFTEAIVTKSVIFENKITRERLICDNIKLVRVFDGVEFLSVHRVNESRNFLIRRDALTEIVDPKTPR
jgi:hypothetical protein